MSSAISLSAQALVCKLCWEECFSTNAYRDWCTTIHTDTAHFSYSLDKMARRATNSQQCEWCKWIQKLDGNKDSNCIDARLSAYQLDGSTPRGNNNVKLQVNERDQVFAVFTDEQNPAADMVTARPMRSDLGLCETCDIAKSWFEECENHPECQKTGHLILPARVIDLGEDQHASSLRLVEPAESQTGKYAALSYCWGAS